MAADFSPCRKYRYYLSRNFTESFSDDNHLIFLMLNPSIADENKNDPTITRCINFAKRLGHDGIIVLNLYALISTDPKALLKSDEPIDVNDSYIKEFISKREAPINIVCAWGNNAEKKRAVVMVNYLRTLGVNLFCFKQNKTGHPHTPSICKRGYNLKALSWFSKITQLPNKSL